MGGAATFPLGTTVQISCNHDVVSEPTCKTSDDDDDADLSLLPSESGLTVVDDGYYDEVPDLFEKSEQELIAPDREDEDCGFQGACSHGEWGHQRANNSLPREINRWIRHNDADNYVEEEISLRNALVATLSAR